MTVVAWVDWETRPAVLLSDGRAFAVLKDGGPWVAVDPGEVADESGRMLPEARFAARFGPLPPLPEPPPKKFR